MRRVIAIAVAGYSVAGCSSFSLDSFKPTPPTVQIQLESTPPGADAVTSLGPACKTPCAVAVPAPRSQFPRPWCGRRDRVSHPQWVGWSVFRPWSFDADRDPRHRAGVRAPPPSTPRARHRREPSRCARYRTTRAARSRRSALPSRPTRSRPCAHTSRVVRKSAHDNGRTPRSGRRPAPDSMIVGQARSQYSWPAICHGGHRLSRIVSCATGC